MTETEPLTAEAVDLLRDRTREDTAAERVIDRLIATLDATPTPTKPLPGWDHPVDGDGLSRWVIEPKCAFISPEGWPCTASELAHDGAWALGHHFDTGRKS